MVLLETHGVSALYGEWYFVMRTASQPLKRCDMMYLIRGAPRVGKTLPAPTALHDQISRMDFNGRADGTLANGERCW